MDWFDIVSKEIIGFEGLRLDAYPDPGTGGEPWTIGVGHTGTVDGERVHAGMQITEDQAMALLRADLQKFADGVDELRAVPLTEHQKAALVSFAFNVGLGNLKSSTLLRHLNDGDYQGAANQFLVWNKAAGHVLPGLVKRREAERAMFLAPDE